MLEYEFVMCDSPCYLRCQQVYFVLVFCWITGPVSQSHMKKLEETNLFMDQHDVLAMELSHFKFLCVKPLPKTGHSFRMHLTPRKLFSFSRYLSCQNPQGWRRVSRNVQVDGETHQGVVRNSRYDDTANPLLQPKFCFCLKKRPKAMSHLDRPFLIITACLSYDKRKAS